VTVAKNPETLLGEPEKFGPWLRHEREIRQVSLEEIAQTTRIPLRMLQYLEEDRYDQLPGEVFAKGFLRSYARAIGLPESEVLGRWARVRRLSEPVRAAPVTAITGPDRSQRFGIAIALVILLLLFTLALSIALRPRDRDAPIELSSFVADIDEAQVGA
jgi:cytoskeletal protein RodZ